MHTHRFILEPYKGKATRHTCPVCGKQRTFARYLDSDTGGHVAANVGRCNREDNCGYHYTPKQYFEDNPNQSESSTSQKLTYSPKPQQPPKPASFIPPEVFTGSLHGHSGNHFVTYLLSLFGTEITSQLISRYFIGNSKHWPGATVFYQIDTSGRVRAGKIMLYSPDTGKRVKEPYNHLTWVHSALKLPDYNLQQCFFGEHLLKADTTKPVAIVESEKTAIIASVYIPQFIWLAAGSKNGLSPDKCQALQGRKVVLYPDLNAFEKWSEKAKEFKSIAAFTISDLLERKATEAERAQGLDLADYLTRFSHRTFIKPASIKIEPKPQLTKEFYKYTFEELTELTGAAEALKRVEQYKALSEQFGSCQGFIIHRCQLLNSYSESQYRKAS